MATPRFTIMRVQRPTSISDEAPWRIIDQNFESLKWALERAITAGTLLSDAQKQLVGDVTGYIGADQTTTVEKIRGKSVDAFIAGDDGKVMAYNHANSDFDMVDKLTDVFTTRGDLLYRGASIESRLAIGASNTILKSDGTDPAWATLTSLLDSIRSTQGVLLYRGASAWSALATGTSGNVLKTQGAGANPAWGTLAFTDLSDVPSSYTSQALKALRVNAGATAVEFFTQAFTLLSDAPSAYTGHGGKFVKVNVGETALEFVAGGGGVTNFVDLGDVPATYVGSGGYFVKVNAGATGLEFVSASGSSPLTTKGDIFTFTTVDARLAVGANYKILQADSAETTGLKWVGVSEAIDDAIGSTQGNILYRNATEWVVLAPGTAGYVLQTGGAAANPSWVAQVGGNHNLLSSTHSDTTAASATRGDVITGQSGPVWARLALGTRRYVLGSDGTDVGYEEPRRRFRVPYTNNFLETIFTDAKLDKGITTATSGTVAGLPDTTRACISITNGTTTLVGLHTNSTARCQARYSPHLHVGVKIVDWGSGTVQIGWLASTATTGTTFNADPGVAGAYFRAINGTDTNFQACTHDGTTHNVTDTGVTVDGSWHDFEIWTPDGGTTWYFVIDGTVRATKSTNVPGTSTGLNFRCFDYASSSSTRTLYISHLHGTMNLPGTV